MSSARPSRRAFLSVSAVLALHGAGACAAQPPEAWIDAFTGWASPYGGVLYARVHRGRPQAMPLPHQTTYQRLRQTIEALELAALPRARVSIRGVPGLSSGEADPHGFLKIALPAGLVPGLMPVTLQVETPGWRCQPVHLDLQVFDDAPGLALISDIDDTLTDTGVTHKLRMLSNTLFHSTWEVRTFPGAAAAVTVLADSHQGIAARPTFYLSGSPWGLHARLASFFARSGFPLAPLVLRRYSQEPLDAYAFKLPHLREIFAAFPSKRWVLLGDSGEKDPEVYATLRREHGDAVAATYIHLVTSEAPRSARFADTLVFRDWDDVVKDAASRKLTTG